MSIAPNQSESTTAELRAALPTTGWRQPAVMLMIMAAAMQLSFAPWFALHYNFAHEVLNFTGSEIGLEHTIREIPGFLSFAAVFFLFAMREQTFALVSLALLGVGVAVTGYFPTALGFYITTFVGSVGFHYYETMHQSLTLQWLPKNKAPKIMGRILSVGNFAAFSAYALIFLIGTAMELSYITMFMMVGCATLALVLFMVIAYPTYPEVVQQRRQIILRKRYWLYYLLTFMTGARRQIFFVFAGWMMVERFGYEFKDVAMLFLVNAAVVVAFAPFVGAMIGRIGERRALMIEYTGLIIVFAVYAFVQNPYLAIALYILDHAFFSFDIALKTYFQKIADPPDIAATAGVAFTINHIAAVFIPVSFGLLWLYSPAAVFLSGSAMACVSLVLAFIVPRMPMQGQEVIWRKNDHTMVTNDG